MKDRLKHIGDNILHWTWTKAVLYWIILSAGTVSECAFLVASLYVSLNASVHGLIITVVPEAVTVHLSQLATAAYVALPECILALSITTTLSHIRVFVYNRREYAALTWSILYGLPTLVFLILSLITIGCSMLSINFQLPAPMIVIRGLSGYDYGLIALLYSQLGTPQEVDRLKAKDVLIGALEERVKVFSTRIDALNAEIQNQKRLLIESQNQHTLLQNVIKKGTDDALQAYGEDCVKWLYSGVKTVTIDDLVRYSGHSKQKIVKAKLRRSPRNQDLILMESIIEWLKETPPSGPQLHIVNG